MKFIIITSNTNIFTSWLKTSIVSKINSKQLEIEFINPRDFSKNKHYSIFDKPFGGGAGLIMLYEPLKESLIFAKKNTIKKTLVIYLSPRGIKLNQTGVRKLTNYDSIIIISGKYRGIDERIIDEYVEKEISIGDFILNSGDLPAMVLMESIIRLLPNTLHNVNSIIQESFENELLDYPNYSKPVKNSTGKSIPDVLLSGHHKNIKNWRLKQQIKKTYDMKLEKTINKKY